MNELKIDLAQTRTHANHTRASHTITVNTMLLTTCAACAAPLAHDHKPRCVRCKTRYCNSTCQHDHWRRGHKQICKKIHRGGNAEKYHADQKYKEATKVAVEACAADVPTGAECYICQDESVPGLVRGCG